MNFEGYVQDMTQKFKLAVAVSVLKNKPQNITSEQYLIQLHEKIKRDEQEIEDFILSDDFDDNSFNYNDDLVKNIEIMNDDNLSINLLADFDANNVNNAQIEDYHENTSLKDSSIEIPNQTGNTDVSENKKDRDVGLGKNKTKEVQNNIEDITDGVEPTVIDVLRMIRDIDESFVQDTQAIDSTQCTYWESSQILTTSNNNINDDDNTMMICDDDSAIEMFIHNYDDQRLNLHDMMMNEHSIQNNNDEKIIANVSKNLGATITKQNVDTVKEKNLNIIDENIKYINASIEINTEIQSSSIKDLIKDKAAKVDRNIKKDIVANNNITKKPIEMNEKQAAQLNKNLSKNIPTNVKKKEFFNSQDTIIYSVHGYTQNNSEISQSQHENIQVSNNFIVGNKKRFNFEDNKNNIQKDNKEFEPNDYSKNSIITSADSNNIQYIIDKEGKAYAVLHQININNDIITNNNNSNKQIENITSECIVTNIESTETDKEHLKKNKELVENQRSLETNMELDRNVENNINSEVIIEINTKSRIDEEHLGQSTTEYTGTSLELAQLEEEIDAPSSQVVNFKVVKELSRIKAYLERKERISTEGFSSDSGYKSDSQHSCYKNSHLSDNWVHQSAHCLYDYLLTCPLVATTQEIINEISQTLGVLIDKLHDEEKYPTFLEELLKSVDNLLSELYHGGVYGENTLLEKDEKIQRLILLNKSTHILKFTIDKTTVILQQIHTSVTSKENLYELVNVQEVENISYIFYLLEILLQKYMKVKDTLSQNTQNSQKVLKKSCITDIWRKKWNFTKENLNVGSQENVCVLTKCGDVLNKIIVECMDGYSLISFAALQCFNMLHDANNNS